MDEFGYNLETGKIIEIFSDITFFLFINSFYQNHNRVYY